MKNTWTCVRCCCLLSVLLHHAAMCGFEASAAPPRGLLTSSEITASRTLAQNWSDETARSFYNMPQGSQLIPYAWFLHLEQPDSTQFFRDTP